MNNVLTIYKSISVDFLVQNFHHNIILILPLMKKEHTMVCKSGEDHGSV